MVDKNLLVCKSCSHARRTHSLLSWIMQLIRPKSHKFPWHAYNIMWSKRQKADLFLWHQQNSAFHLHYLATRRNMLCQFRLGKVATTDSLNKAIFSNVLQVVWWSYTFCTTMRRILWWRLIKTIIHYTHKIKFITHYCSIQSNLSLFITASPQSDFI